MKIQSPQEWFLQKVFEELFLLSLGFWVILFILELLKNGLVSNYLSLPHLALLIFVFGVISLSLKPLNEMNDKQEEASISKRKTGVALLLLVLVVSLVIFLVANVSLPLTLLLIFVTVLAILSGFYSFVNL